MVRGDGAPNERERTAGTKAASRHHAAAPGHNGQSVPTTHTRLRQALLLKQLGQEAARGRCLRGDFVLTPRMLGR